MAKAVHDSSKDWRKDCATLADQLWYMYEQQLCTNMEIRVMSGQKHKVRYLVANSKFLKCPIYNFQVFSCHQLVIGRLCPEFEKEIEQCQDEEDGDCFVNVKNLDPDFFTSVLKYTGVFRVMEFKIYVVSLIV
jgi:hypothetical protein